MIQKYDIKLAAMSDVYSKQKAWMWDRDISMAIDISLWSGNRAGEMYSEMFLSGCGRSSADIDWEIQSWTVQLERIRADLSPSTALKKNLRSATSVKNSTFFSIKYHGDSDRIYPPSLLNGQKAVLRLSNYQLLTVQRWFLDERAQLII